MIVPSFVSTPALSSELRLSIVRVQTKLIEAEKELSTGRHADIGLALGPGAGIAAALRQEQVQIKAVSATNGFVASRLSATQSGLQSISDLAQNFLAVMVRAQASTSPAGIIAVEAQSTLRSLQDRLNTTFDGQYIFAGINSDVRPLDDYFQSPMPSNRQAVANAFLAEFGFSQDAAAAGTITESSMRTFLDTDFPAEFADPHWGANWSSASDKNVKNRIGRQELIETSVNTNEQAFRDFMAAAVMVADLNFSGLNEGAQKAVVDKAVELAGRSIKGVVELQSRIGVAQERLRSSSDLLEFQLKHVSHAIDNLEGVDASEVANRITMLMTQMESAYAVTKRIHDLSIIDYL